MTQTVRLDVLSSGAQPNLSLADPYAGTQYVGYFLKVDSIQGIISRNPSIIGLPTIAGHNNRLGINAMGNSLPVAWSIDLGMTTESIVLNGICIDNDPLIYATMAQMALIARTSWFSNRLQTNGALGSTWNGGGVLLWIDMGSNQGLIDVTDVGGQAFVGGDILRYQGVITNFTYSRVGGNTRWEWKMTVQVINWISNMAAINNMGAGDRPGG